MTRHTGRWAYEGRPVVLLSYGGGVNSTAAAIEIVESGGRIDAALMADTVAERPSTYRYVAMFKRYLAEHGVPLHVVSYEVKNLKDKPRSDGLLGECLVNGTLPSISFGWKSCSQKWKIAPQRKWIAQYQPAQHCWANGGKVTTIIGYDASPADDRRYAHKGNEDDPLYDYSYPLRELGWDREACIERIRRSGLPVPDKSSCVFCAASKAAEVRALDKPDLRRIVLMEARAKPRLEVVEGLWRKAVKGRNGATPRPGSMTEMIRAEGLLPKWEIDLLTEYAPIHFAADLELAKSEPVGERRTVAQWFDRFGTLTGMDMGAEPNGIGDGGRDGERA